MLILQFKLLSERLGTVFCGMLGNAEGNDFQRYHLLPVWDAFHLELFADAVRASYREKDWSGVPCAVSVQQPPTLVPQAVQKSKFQPKLKCGALC